MFESFDRGDEGLAAFWIKNGEGLRLMTKDKVAILKLAVNRQWPIMIKELLVDFAGVKNETENNRFETRLLGDIN